MSLCLHLSIVFVALEHRLHRTRASSQVSASSPSPPYLGRASCSSHSNIVRSQCFFSFATSRRIIGMLNE
ncbi:hypothetical protein GLYMA_07G164750v4 [Glycine max]|nr:hypothetical protein GLYMA_07G164750v4 [Glycine max]KAH1087157.1 hypothetical protein GYH30_018620 [Glycine max]